MDRFLQKFFSGTLVSRLSGFGREVAMAAIFGATPLVAAFWISFRFANLLRRLFGEGALSVAFIPHFSYLREKDPKRAVHFFYDLSTKISIILLLICLLGETILGTLLVKGYFNPYNEEVVTLTMIMLPALIFISLFALNSSFLHCEKHFFLPSVAPTILNLIWIAGAIWMVNEAQFAGLQKLAMIIVFGFAMQWLVTWPSVYRFFKKEGGKKWWVQNHEYSSDRAWGLMKPFMLAIIGVVATQINSALDALFARYADPSGPAYLWYALRLQQLPLALFGVGIASVLLPTISKQPDEQTRSLQVNFSLKKAIALMIPMNAALIALGFVGMNLVYGHGRFSEEAVVSSTICLFAYSFALLPTTMVLILAAWYYAGKNQKTPALTALVAVLANVALNGFFVFVLHFSSVSIALATSLSAFINLFFLYRKDQNFLTGTRGTFLKNNHL